MSKTENKGEIKKFLIKLIAITTAIIIIILRIFIALGQMIDRLLFHRALKKPINNTFIY